MYLTRYEWRYAGCMYCLSPSILCEIAPLNSILTVLVRDIWAPVLTNKNMGFAATDQSQTWKPLNRSSLWFPQNMSPSGVICLFCNWEATSSYFIYQHQNQTHYWIEKLAKIVHLSWEKFTDSLSFQLYSKTNNLL